MNRAIKYRIYPTDEQRTLFAKTFGCCRKIWNLMLETREAAYAKGNSKCRPTPAMYKKDYPFLREVDSLALCNVQLSLQKAYKCFFENEDVGHPKFKSKKTMRHSYTTNNQNGTIALDFSNNTIRLPKVGKVHAKLHRMPRENWTLSSATVSMAPDGNYYCAVLFTYKEEIVSSTGTECIGLDYKSSGLFVTSNGDIADMPHYFRLGQSALAKQQRKLRHMKVGSKNWDKQQKKIAKHYVHIANQRKDFLHKKSAEIANRYDIVCVESLNMKTISNKGFGNGKATFDNGYGMFLNMPEYKLRDRGKRLVKVDKWYPSSQICSHCGHREHTVKDLHIRKWICPDCGAEHDRDVNAAINIRNEGLRLLAG